MPQTRGSIYSVTVFMDVTPLKKDVPDCNARDSHDNVLIRGKYTVSEITLYVTFVLSSLEDGEPVPPLSAKNPFHWFSADPFKGSFLRRSTETRMACESLTHTLVESTFQPSLILSHWLITSHDRIGIGGTHYLRVWKCMVPLDHDSCDYVTAWLWCHVVVRFTL